MSNVQPTSGGTMNTASSLGGSGLALLLALLLLGLLLLHVEQTDGYKHQYARRVRSMKVSGVSGQMSWNSVKPSVGLGCWWNRQVGESEGCAGIKGRKVYGIDSVELKRAKECGKGRR